MYIQNKKPDPQSDCPETPYPENFCAAIQCREIPDPQCQVPRPRPQCRQPNPEPNAEYYEDSSMPRSKASGIAGDYGIYIQPNVCWSIYVHKALGVTSEVAKRAKLTNYVYILNKASGIWGEHDDTNKILD